MEVQRLNQELERRVAERTLELEAINQTLRKEIAERERAEDEVRKQKEVFQKIFEDIPVMIGFVGKDGRIELVNSEWQRTLGWTQEEIREPDLDVYAELFPILVSTGIFRRRCRVHRRVDRPESECEGRACHDVAAAFVLLSDRSSLGIGKISRNGRARGRHYRRPRRISPGSPAWLRWESWLQPLLTRSTSPLRLASQTQISACAN